MSSRIAKRPHDIRADEWLHQIIKGGLEDGAKVNGASFEFVELDDFDSTFVDEKGLTFGLYEEFRKGFL